MQNYLEFRNEDEYYEQYDTPQLLHTTTFPSLAIEHAHHRPAPHGAIIIADPIETYYKSLHLSEVPNPDRLVVAMESGAVCSIFATIDHSQKKESILDPGCQIIAMSEASCHDLGLAYDPSIILNMQSANGN